MTNERTNERTKKIQNEKTINRHENNKCRFLFTKNDLLNHPTNHLLNLYCHDAK